MYRINEEKMYYDMADNQAIVINFVTGMYYGSNLLGSVVLDRLQAGASVDAVLTALGALPGCPADIAEQLSVFIDQLKKMEILVSGPAATAGGEPIDPSALGDGFCFTLDEFAEAQDLLLADPIHDVDVAQGWPVLKDG